MLLNNYEEWMEWIALREFWFVGKRLSQLGYDE